MALIKCRECGKEISDKAAACIHCGSPVNKEPENKIEIKTIKEKRKFNPANIINLFTLIGIALAFVITKNSSQWGIPVSETAGTVADYWADVQTISMLVNVVLFVIGIIIWCKGSDRLSIIYIVAASANLVVYCVMNSRIMCYDIVWCMIIPTIIQVIAGILYVKGLLGKKRRG